MRERIKSVVIAVLFVTLLGQSVLGWLFDRGELVSASAAPGTIFTDVIPEPARPVLAVLARQGSLFAAGSGDGNGAVDAIYDRFRTVFGEALASAPEHNAITHAAWDAALEGDSVLFGFPEPVPVWALSEGLSFTASAAVESLMLKRVILSRDALFISDGENYFRCGVVLELSVPEQLEDTLYPCRFVNGEVVIEREQAFSNAVLGDRFLYEPYLSELLEYMGFNPNTNSKYTQTDGDLVVVDGQRTLHVSPDGRVTYRDGTDYAESATDEREALRICLKAIPQGAAFWGNGKLMLADTVTLDGGIRFSFDYVLDGAVFLDSTSVFIVKGNRIAEANLLLLPAAFNGEIADIMPQRQAALLAENGLELCYAPDGEGQWLPQWYTT